MKYEVGYSKVTGEYFVVSHDGLDYVGDFETEGEAEQAAVKAELSSRN